MMPTQAAMARYLKGECSFEHVQKIAEAEARGVATRDAHRAMVLWFGFSFALGLIFGFLIWGLQ